MAKRKGTLTHRTVENTRYQVVTDDGIWNYGPGERELAQEQKQKLRKAGYDASFWDCRDNNLTDLFGGLFGGKAKHG